MGPKNVFFLDEISTGLDSSTTFLIVKAIRNMVHMAQVPVTVMAAQAPSSTLTLVCFNEAASDSISPAHC